MDCSEFNRLLDSFIDGELDQAQRTQMENHAAQCIDCRKNLAAAEQLRDVLSHINDDISVPLSAQAAWRRAVKAEARVRRMKRGFRACGAVAAVCVLMLGMTVMFKSGDSGVLMQNAPRIESDGVTADAAMQADTEMMRTKTRSVEYIERSIASDDPAQAYEYLCDVIAEYGGTVERESDGDEQRIFVQIPGENTDDFLSAVDSIGEPAETEATEVDENAATVGICVIIDEG